MDDGWEDGWMNERRDRWMMDGWVNGCMHALMNIGINGRWVERWVDG